MKRPHSLKKWIWIPGAVILLLVSLFLLLPQGDLQFTRPILAVETPGKLSLSQTEPFLLDVTISDLGDCLYPAASMTIGFDPSRLEFLGVEEGNLFVHASADGTGAAQSLPEWNWNAAKSNATGLINLMYLDLTGGRHAFSRDLLTEAPNVVLRLSFRLRGSVRPGDVLSLTVEDAVFAAADEDDSLASLPGTLKVQDGRIVIGE